MLKANRESKIVVFDLDTGLLRENFLDICARKFNFSQALSLLRQIDQDHLSILTRAASFMRGRKVIELVELIDNVSLMDSVIDIIKELKSNSCIVGIISNGYQLVADRVGEKINADFVLANELSFIDGQITGSFSPSQCFLQSNSSTCRHRVCKTNAFSYLCTCYQVPLQNSIVIGDVELDSCLAKHVGRIVQPDAPVSILNHVLMPF